ncbi:hypothetical protein JG688_00014726 [Phytophthora aleatoria]|uniref:Uncharacterized protein n=1 Tax=Phytophthora aleatoria TaxID=2496075 RepID=A0A8J5LXD2_9STRA|nr:hypothetical protein JG688_00014726 [Phytophthora aleatoria]
MREYREAMTALLSVATMFRHGEFAVIGVGCRRRAGLGSGAEVVQSSTSVGESTNEARAVDLDDNDDHFEIQSPPKAIGRPK